MAYHERTPAPYLSGRPVSRRSRAARASETIKKLTMRILVIALLGAITYLGTAISSWDRVIWDVCRHNTYLLIAERRAGTDEMRFRK